MIFRARSGVLEPTLEIDDALAVVVGEQVPIGVDHVFFFNTFTGRLLGTWKLPRAQSAVENCTIHNYNVVPTEERDVLVAGNYQAGTWVVDFTNPRRARTVAWSDPPPLDPQNLTLGGAWGSYWYNDAIYETNITEGLNVFRLRSRAVADARQVPFLNPQTQVGPTSAQG